MKIESKQNMKKIWIGICKIKSKRGDYVSTRAFDSKEQCYKNIGKFIDHYNIFELKVEIEDEP